MTTTNAICFQHQLYIIREGLAVQRYRMTTFETDGHFLSLNLDAFIPELHAHDGIDDFHARVQELKILRFVRRAQHVGVGGVRFLGRHFVVKAGSYHKLRHFLTAT
ncbi:hypothetical protein D3C80_1217880 [compost metagenome]